MAVAIPGLLKACALFDMMVGTMHVAYGQHMLADQSIFVTGSKSSALADSQIRFGGAIMASFGAVAWWASYDISQRQVPLCWRCRQICGRNQAWVWAEHEDFDAGRDDCTSGPIPPWQCNKPVVARTADDSWYREGAYWI
jgi:hypothetical protein